MSVDRSVSLPGFVLRIRFYYPPAPPTESESNITLLSRRMGRCRHEDDRLHPVVTSYGAKAKFMRTTRKTQTYP